MEMQLNERMTGSSKSSYQKIGECNVIVRHKNKINPDKIGARGRNIDRIFIETKQGERFMFPNKDLMSARAMARHMSNGGMMEDDIGGYIMRLSEECHDLARVAHHVSYNKHKLDESALEVRGKVRSRLSEIRHTLNRMSKPHGYDMQVNTLNESGFDMEEFDENTLNEEVEKLAKTLGVNKDDKLKEALGSAAKVKLREQSENEEELKKAVEAGNVAGALNALGLKMNPKEFEGKEKDALLQFLGAYGSFGVERGSQKELKDAVQQLANNNVQMLPETGSDEDEPTQFKDKYARLGYKLGQKAPRIKNDLLSNLASRVSYKLSHRGQTGVDPVSKEEAQVTNMILKGAREGGMSESREESNPLREAMDLVNWFENYDASKIFENRKKKELNESVAEWFDWAEVTDTGKLTEDEVWNFTASLVTNSKNPKKVREMYRQLTTADRNRVMENLHETWVPELQQRVKRALGEGHEEEDGPIEAYGVKGPQSKSWRKEFKSANALNKWAEKNDAEVHGTRPLNESRLNERGWPMSAAMGAASSLVGGDDDLEEDSFDDFDDEDLLPGDHPTQMTDDPFDMDVLDDPEYMGTSIWGRQKHDEIDRMEADLPDPEEHFDVDGDDLDTMHRDFSEDKNVNEVMSWDHPRHDDDPYYVDPSVERAQEEAYDAAGELKTELQQLYGSKNPYDAVELATDRVIAANRGIDIGQLYGAFEERFGVHPEDYLPEVAIESSDLNERTLANAKSVEVRAAADAAKEYARKKGVHIMKAIKQAAREYKVDVESLKMALGSYQIEHQQKADPILEMWNKMNGYQTSPKKSLNEFADDDYLDLDAGEEEDETHSHDDRIPTGDMFDDFYAEIHHPDDHEIRQGDYGMGSEEGTMSPVGSHDVGPHHYFREGDEYDIPDAGSIDDTFMQDEDGNTVQKRLYYGDPEQDKKGDNDDGMQPLFPYSKEDFVKHGDENDK